MRKGKEYGHLFKVTTQDLPRAMNYSRKNPNRWQTDRGFEDMEFPGVLNKYQVEIPGAN